MGSFFFAVFGIIWLCIVFGSENKANQKHEAHVSEIKERHDKWFKRVNNGPLNNREFHEKLMQDKDFRDKLFNDCNEVLSSIPEMNGIRLKRALDDDSETIMEMMYNARTGDVSFTWFSGYIKIYNFTKGFTAKPSVQACNAFMKWYQRELRKNGYADATIVSIQSKGNVLGWRFTDGATSYDMIKRELYISD